MPIVEPEVLMDGDHTIETSYHVTVKTQRAVFTELFDQRVEREGMLLKPNMVLSGYDCPDQADDDAVAEQTLKCLENEVPAAVPGIVFLSGGQSDEDATRRLNAMNARGPHPVGALVLVRARAAGAGAQGLGRRAEQSGRCAKGVLPAGEVQRRGAVGLLCAGMGDGRSRLARSSSVPTSSGSTRESARATIGPMLEQFAEDAELAFEGVPVGPFRGKPAIAQAYVDQPPDDEIVILRTRESGDDLVVADYAWRAEPSSRAGTLILRLRDAEISRLLVTFG